jgi:hypothetical protein
MVCLALRILLVEVRREPRTKFIPLDWLILVRRLPLRLRTVKVFGSSGTQRFV